MDCFVVACPAVIGTRAVVAFQGRCVHLSTVAVNADQNAADCRSYFGQDARGLVLRSSSDGDAFNAYQ